jgi:hypothetical protein
VDLAVRKMPFEDTGVGEMVSVSPAQCQEAGSGEFGLKFLEVTPAQILSGFPERAVEDVFTASRRNVPCLVSFNRIEGTSIS